MARIALKCEECGNDGTVGSLYLTIDAKWRDGVWTLEEREDEGGMALDCLECDHRTPYSTGEGEVEFPYGITFKPGFMAVACGRQFTDTEKAAIIDAISNSDMDGDMRISVLDRLQASS